MYNMKKIDENLSNKDFELQRLVREIKAKNGLPAEYDLDHMSTL